MSDSNEQATDVPLHERMYRFAFNARRLGTKATGPGEHHVCTPVFDDGHGFAMYPISMFEEAAVLLERHSQRAPAPSESPSPATVTNEMVDAFTMAWARHGERNGRTRVALEAAVGSQLSDFAEIIDAMRIELNVAYDKLDGAARREAAVGPALARLEELEPGAVAYFLTGSDAKKVGE